MKKFYLIFFLALGLAHFNAQTYCTPAFAAGCADGDDIDSFSIPNASFSDLLSGCSANAYADNTATTINLQASIIYAYSVTHNYSGENVRIWVDLNNDGTFDDAAPELISTGNSGSTTTTNGTLQIPATATLGNHRLRIAVRWNSQPIPCNTDGYGEAHDYTVNVTAAPSCIAPTALTSSSVATTTANISWTAPATAPASGYEYYYSTTNTAPTATTTPSGTSTTTTASLTSLSPATTYYVWVRSKCSTTDISAWSVSTSFITLCTSVTNFSENFDGVAAGVWPSCWYKVGTLGSAYTQANTVMSAPNNMYIYSGSATSLAVVSMPPVSTLQLGTYRLKFKARANFSVGGVIEVGYLTNPTDASTFTALGSFTTTSTTAIDNFILSPITAPAGVSVLAFRHTGTPTNSVLIDDVVYELIPSCAEPTALTSSGVTTTSATISWTAPPTAPANGYEYYYSTTNTAPTATTTPSGTSTTTSATLSSLTPTTTYYVWVRSKCSSTESSPWSSTTVSTAIVNDNCSDAISLTPGGTFNQYPLTGSDVGATLTSDATATHTCQINAYRDAWYKVTVPASGNITLETAATGSNFTDTVLSAYTGTCGAFTQVGCDDDNGAGNFSLLSLTGLTPGSILYVTVWNYSLSNVGQFQISAYDASLGTTESISSIKEVTLYPNPFKDVVMLSDIKNIKTVSVLDLSGRLIKTLKPSRELQLGDLKAGLYLINLNYEDGTSKTIKTIKK